MAGIRPEMRDHPLMVAARYNDAAAEETDIRDAVKAMGLDIEDVLYVAEQRALRVVAVYSMRPEMKAFLTNTNRPMVVPPLTAHERAAFEIAKTTYLDALTIGWRAHEIETRVEGD